MAGYIIVAQCRSFVLHSSVFAAVLGAQRTLEIREHPLKEAVRRFF